MAIYHSTPFKRSRIAVSSVFFANGLLVGCWALLVPVVIANLSITESVMGLIILAGGACAIAALVVSSSIINEFGVRAVIIAAALALAPALFLLQQADSLWMALIYFICFMTALACQDVAMNANAAELEYTAKRPIMSAFHGFWSAGAMTGAMAGGSLILLLGSPLFAALAGALALVLVLAGSSSLEPRVQQASGPAAMPKLLPRQWLPWLFGLIAFAGFVSEGAVIDWSAQFFRAELDSGVSLSGFAFGGFSLSMMLSRFVGDRMRHAFGDRRLFAASVLVACLGLLFATLANSPLLASVGFFLAGFGNANLVPIAFSAAAAIKGLPRGMGIATATLCGYSGLLAAPASLGFIGHHFGFRLVFLLMAVLLLLLLFLAPMVGRNTGKQISR
jgi:MFS family permease